MVYLIIWCAFAVCGYFLAESKNREKGLWTLLCFLFGLLALIPLAIMPAKEVEYVVVDKKEDK